MIIFCSCEQRVEEKIIGQWINEKYMHYPFLCKMCDRNVSDTIFLHFIKNRLIEDKDTHNLYFPKPDYIKIILNGEQDIDENLWDFHVLDVTDSTLKIRTFWGRDTVLLRRINAPNQ